MQLVVSTRSQHKMREIREILSPVPDLEILDLDQAGVAYSSVEEELEPHETFEENAASKAMYFFRQTGIPTVADDSGLEVDALDGRPGVRTKRFAPGEDLEGEARDQANNVHLLKVLEGRPPVDGVPVMFAWQPWFGPRRMSSTTGGRPPAWCWRSLVDQVGSGTTP